MSRGYVCYMTVRRGVWHSSWCSHVTKGWLASQENVTHVCAACVCAQEIFSASLSLTHRHISRVYFANCRVPCRGQVWLTPLIIQGQLFFHAGIFFYAVVSQLRIGVRLFKKSEGNIVLLNKKQWRRGGVKIVYVSACMRVYVRKIEKENNINQSIINRFSLVLWLSYIVTVIFLLPPRIKL